MRKVYTILLLLMFMLFPLCMYSDEGSVETESKKRSEYRSVYVNFYFPNLNNANKLINDFGFENVSFLSNFVFEDKFCIKYGKDLYFGYMIALPVFSTKQENLSYKLPDESTVDRYMEYSAVQVGLTFDKKVAISDKLDAFTGLTFGLTYQEMSLIQIEECYNWDINESGRNNNFSYSYLLQNWFIQPRVKLLYQVINKHSLRIEMGYIWDFLNDSEWQVRNAAWGFYVCDAPESNINGLTFNIGWSMKF